ncbi:hypothetical protein MnTg02_01958 [bacterium MnTg02]|nr:hypothetical protein MnTg02_01958 [bacterium MnTg02]
MGNGDAVAHACGAESLALEQCLEDFPLVEPRLSGRALSEVLKNLLFALRF